MIQMAWRQPPLTAAEANTLFMLFLADDTKDAPWMVMGDLQFWSASSFAHSLRSYVHEQGLNWYVASMLPIQFVYPGTVSTRILAPDVFVAFTPERPHTSYDVEVEGVFPPFVLEVVSPASASRDHEDKLNAYTLLGVQEYALFTPREGLPSTLEGFRRDDPKAEFEPWQPEGQGRLWSAVLGLYLVAKDRLLQAQTPEGRLLLTPEQAEVARRRAEAEQRRAEEEVERLRRELERYRRDADNGR